MGQECSALELKVRLALAAAPGQVLTEGPLTRAIGQPKRALRDALLAKLAQEGVVALEPARRGRRVRLLEADPAKLARLRLPARARLSGALLNALLGAIAPASAPGDARDAVLAAHAAHARGPARVAELVAVRAALAEFPRADVDRALLELERERKVVLGRAIDLGALTAADRAAAIDDPARGLLVYVSRPESEPAGVGS